MPLKKRRRVRRRISPGTYILFFAIFAAVVAISHAPFFDLPFFWDELGYFVPAALDLFHSGALVPRSVTPNAHPPGVLAYLVAVWAVTAWGLTKDVIVALILFLPLAPVITLFSRVLWIYLDQTVDPEQIPH